MGILAIKPFSTLFAEKKCTIKGSNKEHVKTQIQLQKAQRTWNFQKMASGIT